MILQTDKMALNSILDAVQGPVNDASVCEDVLSPARTRYSMLRVKDRGMVRTMLGMFESREGYDQSGAKPYLSCFSDNEDMCFLFEYRPGRRLSAFADGQIISGTRVERVAENLVMACMTAKLPFPLLYLILTQDCVNITSDNNIYFSYLVDLSKMDTKTGEAECVRKCVEIILSFRGKKAKNTAKIRSYALIKKKHEKGTYSTFTELYRDISRTAILSRKKRSGSAFAEHWARNKDKYFRALMILCIVLVIITLLFLLSQLLFGDVPILRLFQHTLDTIGTESMRSSK